MFYVYILKSILRSERRYIGFTTDLQKRLEEHNGGKSPHTAKYVPWKLANYFAFETADKARAFEDYLKSGSGHAFAKKHF
jgi:predicted GIY-YIG superfamily endonuclease